MGDVTFDFRTGAVPASGILDLSFGPVSQGRWRVQRLVADNDGAAAPSVGVFRNSVTPTNLVDNSGAINRNTADEASPIELQQGESLIVRWTGATAGSISTVTIQYEWITQSEVAAEDRAQQAQRPALVKAGYGDDGLNPAW